MGLFRTAATIACLTLAYGASAADLPDAIAAKGETVVLQVHAVGAQIYECKAAETGGQLSWQFREPIASLFREGETVGLHYAGPRWEIGDSLIAAEVRARAPSASDKDIPWLKLEVTIEAENGPLLDVTTVQRINTKGGTAQGPCDNTGTYLPYSAEYVFLGRGA